MPSLVFDQQTSVAPATIAPDAQGARYSDAEGQAIEGLGHQGARIGSDMARVKRAQDDADAVANLQKNLSDGYRQFSTYLEDQQGKTLQTNPNGAGYTDTFTKAFGDWQDQLVQQQPNARTKRMAAEQARSLGDHFFTKALTWENETRRSWRTGQLDDSITGGASLIDADPSAYEPMLHDTLDNITAASADLHPQQGRELAEKATRTFSQAAALSWARSHPQDTINAIEPTQPLPSGGIAQQITDAATKFHVEPHAALAIAQFESHLDPNAKNPQSSAAGIFQQTDANWQDYGNGGDRHDPAANIDAGLRFMADNQHAFSDTFHRDPSTPELYAMHLLGLGGGMALTKAPADMPFANLAAQIYRDGSAPAVVSNNGFSGLTVGQVRAKIGSWMQDANLRTAGMAAAATHDGSEEANTRTLGDLPWLTKLSPTERQAILTHAQSQNRKDDAGMRAIVDQQSNDAIAQLQNGVMPPRVPTFDDYVKAGYPAATAAQKSAQVQSWQNYGAQVAKLSTQSPDEQVATVNSLKPETGDPQYALKLDQYNHALNAAQQLQRVRNDDPIRADQAPASLGLTKPLDFDQPDVFTAQLAARYNQAGEISRTFGTPYTPLAKQEALQIGERLNSEPVTNALQDLALLRNSAPTAQHFMAAMAQIAPAHPILATAAQLAQTNPQVAMTVLQGDRLLNPGKNVPEGEKVSGHVPMPHRDVFAQAWETERGQAYAGLPQTSQADLAAAMAYYAASVPAGSRNEKVLDADTFRRAMDAVAPVADYNGRAVPIPAGTDKTAFADRITTAWAPALAAAGLDAKDYTPGAYQLVSAGVDGAYVPVNGTAPLMAGGRPVVIDLNQPQQPAAAPPDAEPSKRDLKNKTLTMADLRMRNRFR